MHRILITINLLLLIALGYFAKDDLIDYFDRSPAPTSIPISKKEIAIEAVFSPNLGATKKIIEEIAKAKKSILVAAYSFTSSDLAKALLKAKECGVLIKLILDKSQVSQKYSSSRFFINQGFLVKIDSKHAIFHNKFMIIDEKTVITGSFNFTKAAENKNAENLLIIRNNPELAKLYTENWLIHWNHSVVVNEIK